MASSESNTPVELTISGRSYRLVSSSPESEMQRLAERVEEKLQDLGPSAQSHPQALLLVALALAHDLTEAEERNAELRKRSLASLQSMIERVDTALDHVDENGDPLIRESALEPIAQ